MPPTYTMVFKALMTVEGIGKQLAPQINFIEEAQPFVKEILAERYGPKRLMREGGELIRSLSTVVRAFPPTANQLMKQATRGELTFRLENDALKDLRDEHRAASMRVGRAIAFAGCVLAAVQIIDRPGTTVLGTNWMSFVLFCGGIAFITPLVIANVRGR
jgi:ubiquinone biosynthesis protein